MKNHPLMYKSWLIRKANSGVNKSQRNNLCAYNYKTDIFINPLYKTWDSLKIVIDNLKD